jgi:hypothetical protein
MNPINLGLRFLLEVACLIGIGWAAWNLTTPPWRWVLVILVPLTAAAAWGVFAVPDDPSRSGNAPVRVPGSVRLVVEFIVLGAGVAGFALSGRPTIAAVLAGLLLIHYAWSYERIVWLLGR